MVGAVEGRARVLVKEKIAAAGVELLKEHFEVDVVTDMSDETFKERINEYDAVIIRSASKLTADVLEPANRLKVIGRAGSGVDNVDVKVATKKGIVVANAPDSNSLAVAELTLGLLFSMVRHIAQADASTKAGKWEKSKFKGEELTDKVLGLIGFGRIGALVAQRAKGLRLDVIAYDPYVSAERFREMGVEQAETPDEVYAKADYITIHLPKTAETAGFVDAEAIAKMKDGVRLVNCARGGIVDEAALLEGLRSGKVASAALDVFSKEPLPEDSPFRALDNVVLTPHLGASTGEAQDKAGVTIAEQVAAGLLGQFVSNAVNIPSVSGETMEAVGPFLPLAEMLGNLIVSIADGRLEKLTVRYEGGLADADTRLLTVAVLKGMLQGRVEESVNFVNASSIAEERGLQIAEERDRRARDYTNLITVVSEDKRGELTVGGTTIGPKHKPRLVRIYRHDIDLEPAEHMAFFQYDDVPGMIGRVGTALGERGINIGFMNVGRKKVEGRAVMGVALDQPISQALLDEIATMPGFYEARAVEL